MHHLRPIFGPIYCLLFIVLSWTSAPRAKQRPQELPDLPTRLTAECEAGQKGLAGQRRGSTGKKASIGVDRCRYRCQLTEWVTNSRSSSSSHQDTLFEATPIWPFFKGILPFYPILWQSWCRLVLMRRSLRWPNSLTQSLGKQSLKRDGVYEITRSYTLRSVPSSHGRSFLLSKPINVYFFIEYSVGPS